MQVSDRIHVLKVPFQITDRSGLKIPRFVYVYLIYGENISLIDSGVASSEQVIFDYIRKTGRQPEEISQLILTHSHPDHIGSALAIKEASGCTVAAHVAEKAWIEDVDLQSRERPVPGFHSLVGGSVKVDRVLEEGDILDLGDSLNLEVIHTPGHSRRLDLPMASRRRGAFLRRRHSAAGRDAHLRRSPGIRQIHQEAEGYRWNQGSACRLGPAKGRGAGIPDYGRKPALSSAHP